MRYVVIEFADGTRQTCLVLEQIPDPTVRVVGISGTEFLIRSDSCRTATEDEIRQYFRDRIKHVSDATIEAAIHLARHAKN